MPSLRTGRKNVSDPATTPTDGKRNEPKPGRGRGGGHTVDLQELLLSVQTLVHRQALMQERPLSGSTYCSVQEVLPVKVWLSPAS